MAVFVARADNKNTQKYDDGWGSNKYGYQDARYSTHSTSYTKPKPKGLTKEQVTRKKKKIRSNLLKNEEIKKKYNLEEA